MGLSYERAQEIAKKRGISLDDESSEKPRLSYERAQEIAKKRGITDPNKSSFFDDVLENTANTMGPGGSILYKLYKSETNNPQNVEAAKHYANTFTKEELKGVGKQLTEDPNRLGKNILEGSGEIVHGLANAPKNLIDRMARAGVIPQQIEGKIPQIKPFFDPWFKMEDQKPGDKLGKELTKMALALFPAGRVGSPVVRGIGETLGQGGNALVKGGANVARGVGNMPLTLSGVASRMGAEQTIPELQRALETTRGTETPLGDVIQSSELKRGFENYISPTIGSGAEKVYGRIEEDIQNRGQEIINDLTKNVGPEFIGQDANEIVKTLADAANKQIENTKKGYYRKMNQTAEAEGHKLELPKFTKIINEKREQILSDPFFQFNDTSSKILGKLFKYEGEKRNIPGEEGKIILPSGEKSMIREPETIYPNIENASMLMTDLGNYASGLLKSDNEGDRTRGKFFRRLETTLRNEIREQINTKGSPKLKSEYQEANDFYKNSFAQFLNKNVEPLIREGKDPQDILQRIINPSKTNDKYKSIEMFKNILPEGYKDLPAYGYLRRAYDNEGNFNPKKIPQLLKALGPRQYHALFDKPEMREALENFSELVKMNQEPLNHMFNPKTGYRALQAAIFSGHLSAGYAALGPIGAVMAPVAAGFASRYLTNKLTSEEFREKVINKKINRQLKQAARRQSTSRQEER